MIRTKARGQQRQDDGRAFYREALARQAPTIHPYGGAELGDLAAPPPTVRGVLNKITGGALDSASREIAELRTAVTISTAASVAAALAGVFLLLRTGARPARAARGRRGRAR